MAKKREFVVRFAVAREGKLVSAIWRVWRGRNNDNIYIAPRSIAGSLKISLHENRYCHAAVTSQQWRAKNGEPKKRPTLISWMRQDAGSQGWTLGVSIMFAPELLSPSSEIINSDTFLIEAPRGGKAIVVDLIFSRLAPGQLRLEPNQAGELGHVLLQGGEHFAVIGSLIDFDYAVFQKSSNFTVVMDRVAVVNFDGSADSNTRVAFFGDPAIDGHLRILDVGGVKVAAAPRAN